MGNDGMGKNGMDGGLMGGMMATSWPWMILSVVVLVVVLAVLVYLVVFLAGIERRRAREVRSEPGNAARSILDHRFARGEIAEDEYRARRETLTAS